MSEHQKNSNTPPQQDPLAKAYSSLGKTTTNLLKKLSAKIGRKVVTKFVLTMGKVISVVLAKTAIIWAPILALFIVGVMGYMLIYGLPRMVADEAQGQIENAVDSIPAFFGFSEADEKAYEGDDLFEDYQNAADTWDEGLNNNQRTQAFPYRMSWGVLAGVDRMRNDPHIKEKGAGSSVMIIGDHNINVDGLFPPTVFIPIYQSAAEEYNVDWEVLASIHEMESTYSTYPIGSVSTAGAKGPMQFHPCSWVGWSYPGCSSASDNDIGNLSNIQKHGGYGVDANGDGVADIWNEYDAIHAAAKLLSSNGYNRDPMDALFRYNQSTIYGENVLANAEIIRQMYRAHEEMGEDDLEEYDLEELELNKFDLYDLSNWDHLITPDPYGMMEILKPTFEWDEVTETHTWQEERCTTRVDEDGNESTSCRWVNREREIDTEILTHAHTYEGTYVHDYEMRTSDVSPANRKFGNGKIRNYKVHEPVTTKVTPPSEEEYLQPLYDHLYHFNIKHDLDIELTFELIELYDERYSNQREDLDGLYYGTYPEIEGANDWLWPTISTRITSRYGPRSCTGCSTYHRGVDVGGTTPGVDGDPIFAMEDGTVEIATYHSAAGNYITINHGGGVQTRYLHLQHMNARVGQQVQKGDVIGTMGNTGNSYGTHLHFEIIIDGRKLDPLKYFPSIG